MEPEQQRFFDEFEKALNQYLGENGTVNLSNPNFGKPVERLVNRIIKDCHYKSEIPDMLKVNIKHCHLSILLIKYFNVTSTVYYLNGIIIIVSDGRRSLCFHFPLNTTTHTIVNAYFEGNDPILRAYFLNCKIAPVAFGCYLQLFYEPYKVQIFPQAAFGIDAIIEALASIEKHCHNIFCH